MCIQYKKQKAVIVKLYVVKVPLNLPKLLVNYSNIMNRIEYLNNVSDAQ